MFLLAVISTNSHCFGPGDLFVLGHSYLMECLIDVLPTQTFDAVIVGAGGAGLRAALQLAKGEVSQ